MALMRCWYCERTTHNPYSLILTLPYGHLACRECFDHDNLTTR